MMLEWIETPKRAHLVLEIANMGNLSEYIKRVCFTAGYHCSLHRSEEFCHLTALIPS